MTDDLQRKDWWDSLTELVVEVVAETIVKVVEVKNDIKEDYLKLLDNVE
jgi:hypothetical protein